jgi:hypothetical protein
VKIAVATPAAPAPTIATSQGLVRPAVYAALVASAMNVAASLTGTVEIAPHELQRTVRSVGSSDLPMTCVLWLPHFGQTGGAVGRRERSRSVMN